MTLLADLEIPLPLMLFRSKDKEGEGFERDPFLDLKVDVEVEERWIGIGATQYRPPLPHLSLNHLRL